MTARRGKVGTSRDTVGSILPPCALVMTGPRSMFFLTTSLASMCET
jgi:hypothetical protein